MPCQPKGVRETKVKRKLAAVLRALPAVLLPLVLLLPGKPLEVLPTLAALALHECGHLLAFSLLREPAPAFSFSLGGFRFIASRPLSYRAEGWVAAAGPLANLAAAAILFLLSLPFPAARAYLIFSAMLELSSAVWNLLPIADLDGARILSALLSPLPPHRADAILRAVSLLVLFLGLTVSLGILYFSGAAFYTSLALLLLLFATP